MNGKDKSDPSTGEISAEDSGGAGDVHSTTMIFVWNIVLALLWAFGIGKFTLANLSLGFLLGYFMLWLGSHLFHAEAYCRKLRGVLGFLAFLFWEVSLANVRVAQDVMALRPQRRAGILALPLDAQSDLEIMLLANCLGLTPGTLAVDVSGDRKTLYVHVMHISNADAEKRRMKEGFERRLLEILR